MSLCIREMRSQRLLTCLASPTPLSNTQHNLSQPNLKHSANMADLNKSGRDSGVVTGLQNLCHFVTVTTERETRNRILRRDPPYWPQQPQRSGIPPTASVAGLHAVVTEAKWGDTRVYKILKTRHLNLASPARKKPTPPTPPVIVHKLPGRAGPAARPGEEGEGAIWRSSFQT